MKNNRQIERDEKIYFGSHIVTSFILALITLKIIFLLFNEFQIEIDWSNQTSIIGRTLMTVSFLFLFLIYDILMSSLTDIDGLITTFIKSMNNDFNPERYINNDQHSIFEESNIASTDFVKEFDSNILGNHGQPLEELNITQESNVGAEQKNEIIEEFKPKEIEEPEHDHVDKSEIEGIVRTCMSKLMEETIVDDPGNI